MKRLFRFTVEDIQDSLFTEFQFELPFAVVQTALKNVPVTKNNGVYTVDDLKKFQGKSFEDNCNELKQESSGLIDGLLEYAENDTKKDMDEKILRQEFLHYMLNDGGGSEYAEIISEYILANSQNRVFQQTLNEIKAGCILYNGIIYNLDSTGLDVFSNGITFYLDTEILMDLGGYNGELFRQLAEDFTDLVKQANGQGHRIQMKCLKINMDEALSLFGAAKKRFQSRRLEITSTAIESIMNGCKDESDVVVKQADFITKLKIRYSIVEEEKESYYVTEEDEKNNLESMKLPEEIQGKYSEELLKKYSKILSHVNKHRGNPAPQNIETSRAIFITRTSAIMDLANSFSGFQAENGKVQYVTPLTISLGGITNYLWNRLNKGFSSQKFPSTIDVVIKAQTILSKKINENIIREYNQTVELYKNKEITKEVLVGRIKALREKPRTPELLTEESFESAIDFDIGELDKYEEERSLAEKRMNDAIAEKIVSQKKIKN